MLLILINFIQPSLRDDFIIHLDLPGHTVDHGGVIPPHILVTALHPDLCIINEMQKVFILFELTCPWDGNIARSHTYKVFKEEKCAPLIAELSAYFSVFNFSVEVSARGHITKEKRSRIKVLIWRCCQQPKGLVKPITLNVKGCSTIVLFNFLSKKESSVGLPWPSICSFMNMILFYLFCFIGCYISMTCIGPKACISIAIQ